MIEPHGDWHTEDDKYGTEVWLAKHQSTPKINGDPTLTDDLRSPTSPQLPDPLSVLVPDTLDSKGKRKAIEIISSDEDDEFPLSHLNGHASSSNQPSMPTPHRGMSSSSARPTSRQASQQAIPLPNARSVIDLTLDVSDENDEDDDEVGTAYFRQPDAGFMSRGTAESTQTHHEVCVEPEPNVRLNDFGERGGADWDTWQEDWAGGGDDRYRNRPRASVSESEAVGEWMDE